MLRFVVQVVVWRGWDVGVRRGFDETESEVIEAAGIKTAFHRLSAMADRTM